MDFALAYDGLRRSYAQGFQMEDADWIAALYAEDGVLLGPGFPPVMGRDAVRAHTQEYLDAYTVELLFEPAETQQLGDKGFGYGTFKVTMTPRKGGTPSTITGNYLNIVQSRPDGTLEILRHCWNADQAMPG